MDGIGVSKQIIMWFAVISVTSSWSMKGITVSEIGGYIRGDQSYPQRAGVGAGLHSNQAEAPLDSTSLIS